MATHNNVWDALDVKEKFLVSSIRTSAFTSILDQMIKGQDPESRILDADARVWSFVVVLQKLRSEQARCQLSGVHGCLLELRILAKPTSAP